MTKENEKILTLSFLLAGLITAVVVNALFTAFAGTWTLVAKAYSIDVLRHGLPVGLGLITFLILQFNSTTLIYFDEVVTEIKKVVWPTKKDTVAMTIVVITMLIISSALLGVFDFISNNIVKFMLRSL